MSSRATSSVTNLEQIAKDAKIKDTGIRDLWRTPHKHYEGQGQGQ